MDNINFKPIFDYIDQSTESLRQELKEGLGGLATKEDVKGLQTAISNLASQTLDNSNKVTLLDGKANRLEAWVIPAAKKIELPYNA